MSNMLEIDEASLAKESKARKSQIDSMVEEEKREELVSEDLNRSLFIIFQSLILFYSMI